MRNRLLVAVIALALMVLMAVLVLPRDEAPFRQTSGPRVISFSPALTETLYELGVGETLVGADSWSIQRRQVIEANDANRIYNLGAAFSPVNPEQVIRLEPTLVLTQKTSASGNLDFIRKLDTKFEEVPFTTLEEILAAYLRVGILTKSERKAQEWVSKIESSLVPVLHVERPKVLILNTYFPDQEPTAVGGASYQSQILEKLGGENVLRESRIPTVFLTAEKAALLGPDLVILLGTPPNRISNDHYIKRFDTMDAVRLKQYYFLEGTGSLEQGPSGVLQLIESIKEILLKWQESTRK